MDRGKIECLYPSLWEIYFAESISRFPLWLKFFIFRLVFLSSTNSSSNDEQNFRLSKLLIFFATSIFPLPILTSFLFVRSSAKILITCETKSSTELYNDLSISFPQKKIEIPILFPGSIPITKSSCSNPNSSFWIIIPQIIVGCFPRISSWRIVFVVNFGVSSFVVRIRFPSYVEICSGRIESNFRFRFFNNFENLK